VAAAIVLDLLVDVKRLVARVIDVDPVADLRHALEAIHALPEPDRTVFLSRVEEGLSYEEIAARAGLSVVAARVKVFRARARIVSKLRPNPKE